MTQKKVKIKERMEALVMKLVGRRSHAPNNEWIGKEEEIKGSVPPFIFTDDLWQFLT